MVIGKVALVTSHSRVKMISGSMFTIVTSKSQKLMIYSTQNSYIHGSTFASMRTDFFCIIISSSPFCYIVKFPIQAKILV